MTFDVHYYVTDGGRDVFLDWISGDVARACEYLRNEKRRLSDAK